MEIVMWILLFLIGLLVLAGAFFLFMRWRFSAKVTAKKPKQYLDPATWNDDEVTVGWVGHSTILINLYGYRILTDPVFGKEQEFLLGFIN